MSNTVIIIVAVIVLCVALVAYNHHSNKNRRFHVEGLGAAVKEILSNQPGGHMKREEFLRALRAKYNCSPKEALYLLGYARKHNLVHQDAQYVTLL